MAMMDDASWLDALWPGPVVVVSPHPDDDVLGCAGLICACLERGIALRVLALTAGEGSHPGSSEFSPDALAILRSKEQHRSLCALGWRQPRVQHAGFPDGAVGRASSSQYPAPHEAVRSALADAKAVFVTALDDQHADHRAAAQLVERYATHAEVFHYAIWPGHGGPGPEPVELDVRPWLELKRRAIWEHRTQLGDVVRDDPSGFRLPNHLVARALSGTETFWRVQ